MEQIYENENWIIEVDNDGDNPIVRISAFKDNHFVDDIELSLEVFKNGDMDAVKNIIYR